MGLFDLNTLTPEQVRQLLTNLDGITAPVARRFGDYYAERGAIRDQDELIDKLREFGLRPNAVRKVRTTIDVGPRGRLTDTAPFLTGDGIDFAALDEATDPVQAETDPPGEAPRNNRPLVLVPGIMGSELYSVVTSEFNGTPMTFRQQVWPPLGVLGIDNLKQLAKLIRDQQLLSGPSTTLNAYTQLIANLAAIGYEENRNLFVFTYNWIRSNALSGRELADRIPQYLERFNEAFGANATEVDVICHSMGGLVTRSAIVNAQAPVGKTVYLGTPHSGTPKAYFVLHPGIKVTGILTEILFDLYDLLVVEEDEFEDLDRALHTLASLCPSVYELLPDEDYLRNNPMLEINPGPFSANFYARTVDEVYFSGKWQFPPGQQLNVQRGLAFKDSLGKRLPGDNLIVACNDLDTSDEVQFDFDIVVPDPTDLTRFRIIASDKFEAPTASLRQGDQTVATFSGVGGTLQNSRNTFIVRKTEHTELATAPRVFFKIREFLGI